MPVSQRRQTRATYKTREDFPHKYLTKQSYFDADNVLLCRQDKQTNEGKLVCQKQHVVFMVIGGKKWQQKPTTYHLRWDCFSFLDTPLGNKTSLNHSQNWSSKCVSSHWINYAMKLKLAQHAAIMSTGEKWAGEKKVLVCSFMWVYHCKYWSVVAHQYGHLTSERNYCCPNY